MGFSRIYNGALHSRGGEREGTQDRLGGELKTTGMSWETAKYTAGDWTK